MDAEYDWFPVQPDDDDDPPENAPVLSTRTDIPKTLAEAKRSPDWGYWKAAYDTEIAPLM